MIRFAYLIHKFRLLLLVSVKIYGIFSFYLCSFLVNVCSNFLLSMGRLVPCCECLLRFFDWIYSFSNSSGKTAGTSYLPLVTSGAILWLGSDPWLTPPRTAFCTQPSTCCVWNCFVLPNPPLAVCVRKLLRYLHFVIYFWKENESAQNESSSGLFLWRKYLKRKVCCCKHLPWINVLVRVS